MKSLLSLVVAVLVLSISNLIAQSWTPSENSHFGVDGFETADFFRFTPTELDAAYEWEAAGLRNVNICWNRTLSPAGGQFRWEFIEAVKGTYDWSKPDAFVKKVQVQGIQLLVLIHPFTPWDQPGKNNMNYDKPNDMTAFKKFIAKVVERYDNDGIEDMPGLLYPIKYYEIGNEPEGQTFGNSPGTYNDFMNTVKAAYDTAKVVYPNIKIVIGGASPIYEPNGFFTIGDTFWKGALNRPNVSDYFDVFNFHFFVGQYTKDLKDNLDYWKTLLASYSLSGKEIWMTETGTHIGTPTGSDNQVWPNQTPEYQAGWWIRQCTYGIANDLNKLFWVFYYTDQNDWKGAVAFVNSNKTTKKAVYYSHKLMAEKIDAFTDKVQNSYSAAAQYQTSGNFKFTVNNKPVYVVWNDAGGNAVLNGLSSTQIKVTKAVPNLDGNGAVVLDGSGNPTFETSNAAVTGGQVTVALTSVPVYVEEIAAPPSAPTLLSPANNATSLATNPTLSWNAVSGANSYRLQVSANQNFSPTIFEQINITTTSRQVSGLSNLTQYFWRVNATNNNGTSDWSNVWSFTTQGAAPDAPTLLSPADGSINIPTTASFSWAASSGATSYRLQVSTDQNFSTVNFEIGNIATTSQQVGVLSNSTSYHWRVDATNSNGTSTYSGSWQFTTAGPTSVDDNDSDIPKTFFLYQNYPNPFNPATTINYSVPIKCFVTIKVIDLLGNEVQTLINGEKLPGKYRVNFNAVSLSSGVYFYQLVTKEKILTNKFVLLK